ncbi:MAG: site-2 protease family protein [Patescibacteria group bacterium]
MLLLALFTGQLSLFQFLAILAGIIIGISFHEFAHAFVAYRCGDPTAKIEGRLSLNPLVHLDTVGTIMLLLVGFGWGKPVPVNPRYLKGKNDELKVAMAGILTNILIAFILGIPIRIANMSGILIDSSSILVLLEYIITINLGLAVFNLLPLPPLDGSHVLEHFLPEDKKESYRAIGPLILFGIIILSFSGSFSIFSTILEPIIRFLSFLVQGSAYLRF